MPDESTSECKRNTLKSDIRALRDLQAKLALNETRSDEGFRLELVALRRQTWDMIYKIENSATAFFCLIKNPDQEIPFWERFRKMKDTAFEHQSRWRGLDVSHSNPDYRPSVARVMEANRNFTEWAVRSL